MRLTLFATAAALACAPLALAAQTACIGARPPRAHLGIEVS